jgi:membrane protein
VRATFKAAGDHQILSFAAAIAFRLLVAFVFLGFALIALIGAVRLQGVWQHTVAPDLQRRMPKSSFEALNTPIRQVLQGSRGWWIHLGWLLAIWQVSVGVRTAGSALNVMYDVEERRSFPSRNLIALGLAVVICLAICLLAVLALTGYLVDARAAAGTAFAAGRWIVALVVLWGIAALVLRLGPGQRPDARWVSVGSTLIVVCWGLASVLFALYVRTVTLGHYEALFGSLSMLIVVLGYLYVSACAFLFGAELDAVRQAASERPDRGDRR